VVFNFHLERYPAIATALSRSHLCTDYRARQPFGSPVSAHGARQVVLQKSEQEQAEQHEHEEEEPYLMQRSFDLHVPPSLPGVHQVVRAPVVRARRLRLPSEHPRQHGHRHAPEHPSGRRVHHPAVPKRRWEEGIVLRGVGVVPRLQWCPGRCVGVHVPVVVAAAVVAVLNSPAQSRPARDAAGQAARRLLGAGAPAAAVERHERVGGRRGLAHGAPPPRRARVGVGAQPLVDAGPAVEVAAKRDHRLRGALEADVAVEAAASSRRHPGGRRVPAANDPLRGFIAGSCRRLLTGAGSARLIHVLHALSASTRLVGLWHSGFAAFLFCSTAKQTRRSCPHRRVVGGDESEERKGAHHRAPT